MNIGIIGSGPSALSAVKAIIDSGIDSKLIHVIDANLEEKDPFVNLWRHEIDSTKKLYFGSSLPYRGFPHGTRINLGNTSCTQSFAFGGLSLVWGATMLPYPKNEISSLSISELDFINAYESVADLLPSTRSCFDSLNNHYIDFSNREALAVPNLTLSILKRLKRLEEAKKIDFVFGQSRLAIENNQESPKRCEYLGSCLEGCKLNSIWNTRHTWETIAGDTNFSLGTRVDHLKIVSDKIAVSVLEKDGSVREINSFDKVFLACGPIETFGILSKSGFLDDNEIALEDTYTFYLPFLYLPGLLERKNKVKKQEKKHNLSQFYFSFSDALGQQIHVQFYELARDMAQKISDINPFYRFLMKFFLPIAMRCILIGICYMPAAKSPKIIMKYDKSVDEIRLFDSSKKTQRLLKVLKSSGVLFKSSLSTMLIPLPLIKIQQSGHGVHYGSWLNRIRQKHLERVSGGMVEVIDSSSLNHVSAGPITFTIMANSYLITRNSVKTKAN